jgi:ribokinase
MSWCCMKNLLVIGSMNVDMVARVEHIPQIGETILSDRLTINTGGKGANQAYAAAKLGGRVSMMGLVGNDAYGEMLIESLKSVGTRMEYVQKIADGDTGTAWILVTAQGDNSIIVIPGANMRMDPAFIDRNLQALRDCDTLMMQLEVPLETVCYAAQKAKELGKTVILNPAPASTRLDESVYRHIDILTPNETELSLLTGIPDVVNHLEEAADRLLAKGVGNVVATLGPHGAYWKRAGGESRRFYPSRVVTPVDSTAAGDSFAAAMAVELMRGGPMQDAIVKAMRVAEIVIMRKGAQASIPTKEEVDRALSQPE